MHETEAASGNRKIPDQPVANQWQTLDRMLERSKTAERGFTPLHKVFVQTPSAPKGQAASAKGDRSSVLADFVSSRDRRGLLTYLLITATTTAADEDGQWSTTYPLRVWARAIGLPEERSSGPAMSKVLARLERRNLITRARRGVERGVCVSLLRPDGSGEAFTRDDYGDRDRYLTIPNAFWTEEWLPKLDLPALAMFLVLRHAKDSGAALPIAKMRSWYGWSGDTAQRGLATLNDIGALDTASYWRTDPLSPIGRTRTNHYRLVGPLAERQSTRQHREEGET